MQETCQDNILLFFAVSILGWLMEVVCKYVQFGRFVNRGFLIGPYCPIYGVGALLVWRMLSDFRETPAAVFSMAILICGILEYITGFLMEKLFHARWWDYSQKPFNLNGRVCLQTLIPFGFLAILLIYGAAPALFSLFHRIPAGGRGVMCVVLCAAMACDILVSTRILSKIRSAADLSGGDNTEEITQKVREALARQGALPRRALRAFPNVRFYNRQIRRQLREAAVRLKEETREKNAQFRREIEAYEQKIQEESQKRRNQRR